MHLISLAQPWNPADIVESLAAILPLPKGEGRGEGEADTRRLPTRIAAQRTNIPPPPPGSADWQSAVSPAGSRLVSPAFTGDAIVKHLRTIQFDYWNLIIFWSLEVGAWSFPLPPRAPRPTPRA